MPGRWALLIGIDHYIPGDERRPIHFKHLSGCVRDVNRIEEYLRSIGVDKIERLTASRNYDGENPKEPENRWPTHKNIRTKFESIEKQLKEGDLLYIHYSGHGILRQELGQWHYRRGDAITGTALALTDVQKGGAYLTGYQLGVWIRRLVKKRKARVTLVLDSCFSGKGLRDDEIKSFERRTPDYDGPDAKVSDADKAADDDAHRMEAELGHVDEANVEADYDLRNANIKPSWLFSPLGCTVLSGCQLNQKAGEYRFDDQDGRTGILTHWMLDILSNPPGLRYPTYSRIAQHARSQIQTQMPWNEQTPVLHGDCFHEFFGNEQLAMQPASSVKVLNQPGTSSKLYELDIGAAQGVEIGAIYALYPSRSNPSPHLMKRDAIVPRIRVTEAKVFSARATLVGDDNVPDEDGYLAVRETWAFNSPKRIRLPSNDLPDFRTELRTEISNDFVLDESHPDGNDQVACSFICSVNGTHIEARDEQNVRLDRVPTVSIEDPERARKFASTLNHLARFSTLRCLAAGKMSGNLTFEPLDKNKKPLELSPLNYDDIQPFGWPIPITYVARDKQLVCLRFRNMGTAENIHVAIFSFNATWGIEKFYPEEGQPMALVPSCPTPERALTKQDAFVSLLMNYPAKVNPESDAEGVLDLYRAYVYQGRSPPSWDEICLPSLSKDVGAIAKRVPIEPVHGRMPGEGDERRNAIKVANYDLEDEFQDEETPEEDWTFFEFRIHLQPED